MCFCERLIYIMKIRVCLNAYFSRGSASAFFGASLYVQYLVLRNNESFVTDPNTRITSYEYSALMSYEYSALFSLLNLVAMSTTES